MEHSKGAKGLHVHPIFGLLCIAREGNSMPDLPSIS